MAKWGEIKCPRCSAPPISLWESMGRSLEEGDAREARLEARIAELETQITAMDEGLTAVHLAGYMDGKRAAEDDLVEMARLAQHDERMATGALYGDLADRIEELEAEIDFLNAQLEAWQEMAPPPLRKRLEERFAAIRKGGE